MMKTCIVIAFGANEYLIFPRAMDAPPAEIKIVEYEADEDFLDETFKARVKAAPAEPVTSELFNELVRAVYDYITRD